MNTFFERLREERKRLGLNQTAFATAGGVLKGAQINYESGERSPDAKYLAAIAAAGADVLYILTGQRPEVFTPPDEVALLQSYRRCPPEGKANLLQTAVLLSAGITVSSQAKATSSNKVNVSSTHGHAAGRDVHVNQGGPEDGGQKNIKPRRARSGA